MAAKPAIDASAGERQGDPLEIPALRCGAMAEMKSYPASPAHQQALGYPGELVDDWQEKAIAKLGELVRGSRALKDRKSVV